MAAYAALVSLTHFIEQMERHPRPPLSLEKEQAESLTENVSFLQEFLEGYSHVVGYTKEAEALESRIADAAYAAEDVIESHIVDQILTSRVKTRSSIEFYQGLQEVIKDMDLIKNEVMELKEKMKIQNQLHISSSIPSGFASTWQNITVVGFDEDEYQITDILTGEQADRLIISIVGMGGIGKTTLARSVYKNEVVVHHFDILVWVTISQECRMREILEKLLLVEGGGLSEMDEYELGVQLHKRLLGRRYLIILDDVWDIEVWDQLKLYLPNCSNGSRIMLTTRLYTLVSELDDRSYYVDLDFLDDDDSWKLFCECVFGEEECPHELEETGVKIVDNCQGLPLSIVVIGRLLAKSEKTQQYWEYIAENLNSIVNLEDNERCLEILYMSYNNLPVYLKPCFLYMGVFPEDSDIRVSKLIKLWVAEGFLKPIDGKSMEDVAEEYLEELFERSLILVEEYNYLEKLKFCKIHDLLRDLCLREARKQKFLCVLGVNGLNTPQELDAEHRICINRHRMKMEYPPHILDALESASHARSLIWESEESNYLPSFSCRLLRVCSVVNNSINGDKRYLETVLQQVNLRYLRLDVTFDLYGTLDTLPRFPSSVSLLWNLQTLIVTSTSTVSAPSEIWEMSQLRHVMFTELELPDPSRDVPDDIVLENLQTLSEIINFKCSDEVVRRIPNISKLKISYDEEQIEGFANNLGHLHNLQSLRIFVHSFTDPENLRSHLVQNLIFPHSLKKLTLIFTYLHWEDLATMLGSLPLLEVLKLSTDSVMGPEWETIEGQFCSLKVFLIEFCDLEYWWTNDTHFPRLEHLGLQGLEKLREIPSSVGDIPTLQLIELDGCSHSAVDSAKRIQEEQEELGNDDLEVCY